VLVLKMAIRPCFPAVVMTMRFVNVVLFALGYVCVREGGCRRV
jgi:hypothetical protein